MKNLEIAKLLYEIADILELLEVQWEPRAYRNAARSIEALSEDISKIEKRNELKSIPGVGKSIEKSILDYLKTGKISKLEKLKKKEGADIVKLLSIPGMGPKTVKLLKNKLRVKNLADLKKAAKSGKIKVIKGMGEVTEKNILEALTQKIRKKARMTLGYVMPIAQEIKTILQELPSVKQVEVVGSYRRMKETVGDLDILVVSSKPQEVSKAFTTMDSVKKVLAKGNTRSAVRLKIDLNVDLRVVKASEYGSALQYFTGSKEHSVELRRLAIKKGFKVSEYGVFNRKTGKRIAGSTESGFYKALGLQYIPPELRENLGEIEAAQKKKLPKLLSYGDVKADFQMHTTWSDGAHSIEEMAKEAQRLGHKVIAITDHLGPLKIANSLDAKRFTKYLQAIEKANKNSKVHILKGAEVDILKNGKISATKKQLEQLDYVLAAVHSSFKMSKQEMTKRITTALQNYNITTLAHPTTRRLDKRGPIDIDMEKLFDVAKNTNTFLEINCHPTRMDLNGSQIKAAIEAGCKLIIGTDSHDKNHLHFIQLGEALARRGWATKKDILNCWTKEKILKSIKKIE